jgi:DNA-binding transcriptional MerR regulator
MSISEMCAAYDVTPRALRFYESKELINPIRQRQRRLYTKRDRARLTLILRGKRFGFSLEEIRQLLDLYNRDPGHTTQLQRTLELARERLHQMERQRDELIEAISELRVELEAGQAMLDAGRKDRATT